MQKIVQFAVEEGTPFLGDILEARTSARQENLLELRVRPQPYASLTLQEARLLTQAGESIPVTLRRVQAAPASPTLGHFGDLIISLEGATLEQAKRAQRLRQEQRK